MNDQSEAKFTIPLQAVLNKLQDNLTRGRDKRQTMKHPLNDLMRVLRRSVEFAKKTRQCKSLRKS